MAALCMSHQRSGFMDMEVKNRTSVRILAVFILGNEGFQVGADAVGGSSTVFRIYIDNCKSIVYNIDRYRWEGHYGRTKDSFDVQGILR